METRTRKAVLWTAAIVIGSTLFSGVTGSREQPSRPNPRAASESQRVAREFQQRLDEIDALLMEGQAEGSLPKNPRKTHRAYKWSSALFDEIIERSVAGSPVGEYLGVALTLRAIAAVQLGRSDEGLWHWHIAPQLAPDITDWNLEPYGEAGVYLREHPVREAREGGEEAQALDPSFEPPKKRKTPKLKFPTGQRMTGVSVVDLVVEVIVGTDGRPREPLILDSQGQISLVATTLETLRRWEFEPARTARRLRRTTT